jgi:putative ATP-dependent endonuclease of OLD family
LTRIREVEINNFRVIKKLIWHPSNGINCLIGCGDSGKSSVLDAIDLCIGARKNWSICDADFYQLDIENSIKISVTIGGLSDSLKNIDKYGYYLRGFDSKTSKIEDEPDNNKLEDVLTVIVIVNEDLEPTWSLFSERTSDNDFNRYLTWSDRMSLSPTRIGNTSDYNLS